MLVLGRRKGESIIIDGDVTITFLGYSLGQAKIGVDAPREKVILREEIADADSYNSGDSGYVYGED